MADRDVPVIIRADWISFRRLQRFWFGVHYLCGLAGAVTGILATQRNQAGASLQMEWWGWGMIAAVATGLVTFLGPLQKGERYKHAYFRLSKAITYFESVPNVSTEWLLKEHGTALEIVLTGEPPAPHPAPGIT